MRFSCSLAEDGSNTTSFNVIYGNFVEKSRVASGNSSAWLVGVVGGNREVPATNLNRPDLQRSEFASGRIKSQFAALHLRENRGDFFDVIFDDLADMCLQQITVG